MTDVDICNLALSYLGDSATVTSINPPDGSVQAMHCARFYPLAVKILLEMHDWDFITTRAMLVAVQECYDGWRFAYAMPSFSSQIISVIPKCDYIAWEDRPWERWECWARPFEMERVWDYQLETNPDGVLVILSNAHEPICRYTTTQFVEASLPGLFTDALAWRLAAMLAGPIIKGEEGAEQAGSCLKAFGTFVSEAMKQDANQRRGSKRPEPVWTRDR